MVGGGGYGGRSQAAFQVYSLDDWIRFGQKDELWFGCVEWKVPVDFLGGVSGKKLGTWV